MRGERELGRIVVVNEVMDERECEMRGGWDVLCWVREGVKDVEFV